MVSTKLGTHGIEKGGQSASLATRDRPLNELCLPALAVGRHYETAGEDIRRFGSMIAPHNVEQEVDARRATG